MSISQKDVEQIASLARIELTEVEKSKFEKDLSAILDFVEKLNEVDTRDIEPMTGGTNLENISRPDEQIDKSLEGLSEILVETAHEKKDDWIRVRAIFE